MRTREGNKERAIIESAIKVFAETGYHESKISKIAEIAGIATGSIYLYFKNKEEILERIFQDVWSRLDSELSIIEARLDFGPVEKLDGMIDLIFVMLTENSSLAMIFSREYLTKTDLNSTAIMPLYNSFFTTGEKIIGEGINKKVFSPTINVSIFRHFVLGGVRNILHQWAEDPTDFPLDLIRQNLKDFIKKGILIVK